MQLGFTASVLVPISKLVAGSYPFVLSTVVQPYSMLYPVIYTPNPITCKQLFKQSITVVHSLQPYLSTCRLDIKRIYYPTIHKHSNTFLLYDRGVLYSSLELYIEVNGSFIGSKMIHTTFFNCSIV
jgi:hypothetical protein